MKFDATLNFFLSSWQIWEGIENNNLIDKKK